MGSKVGLTPLAAWCGGCDVCERGLERYCANAKLHGWHRDGFLAEYVAATERALVRLPDDADAVTWAPLFATGWTAMGAVRAAGIGAGLRLGVFGVGGLGHLVVQLGRAMGLEVAGFDVDPLRADAGAPGPAANVTDDTLVAAVPRSSPVGANECGAVQAAARGTELRGEGDVGHPSPRRHVEPRLINGPLADSLDAAIVCTPSAQAISQAVRAVRRGGRVVLAGASPSVRLDVSLFDTVMRGISLVPAFLGARSDLEELITLTQEGMVRPLTHRMALREVPKRFWLLRDGGFRGRLVVTPGD